MLSNMHFQKYPLQCLKTVYIVNNRGPIFIKTLFTMFITTVCVLCLLSLIKLRWPKNKSFYFPIYHLAERNIEASGLASLSGFLFCFVLFSSTLSF